MVTPQIFTEMRSRLREISAAMDGDYLVSASLRGDVLMVSVGREERLGNWKKPYVLTFDSEDDYSLDPQMLIVRLTSESPHDLPR